MKRICLALLCSAFVVSYISSPAQALPPFKKAFLKKYVDESGNEAFQKAAKKKSCNICHVKKQKKKVQNDYGKALAELIEGDAHDRLKEAKKAGGEEGGDAAKKAEMKKLLEELEEAFKKVENMESPSGETWGKMFKDGKLPD